jgi:hypothetical protein
VWFLILLLYTPLLHTSMTFLDCPALDGGFTPRWYVNGNIRCFQDPRHAPLGLLAIFVLFCCLGLIPLVVAIATKKLTTPYWTHCLVTPLTDAYKEKFSWWCGVELAKRVILVLFAVVFKKNDYAVIFSILVILTSTGFLKPYKDMLANILDVALGTEIYILLTLRNTAYLEDIMHIIPEQKNSDDRCAELEGYTPFVQLLAPFYYLPVLLVLTAAVIWLCLRLWRLSKEGTIPMMPHKKMPASPSLKESVVVARTRTETVVDIREYNEDESSEKGSGKLRQRKASFDVRQALGNWSSVKKRLGRSLSRHKEVPKEEKKVEIELQDMVSTDKKLSLDGVESEHSTGSNPDTGQTLLTETATFDDDDSYSNI